MEQDFSKPQKQSAAGIVIMFANTLQKAVRALALPVIFMIIKSENSNRLIFYIIVGSVLLTLILAVITYIGFQKFTFFLDEERQEFIINKGVFNKSTLTIQLRKIQQVNINQSLLQQAIGVYSLDIDTAGSEKKEASIKAIDHSTALKLKEKLLNRRQETEIATTEALPKQEQLLLSLSPSTLFKVGITTNYGPSFVMLGGFILGLVQLFKDYTNAFKIEDTGVDKLLESGISFFGVCILIVLGLMIILATNIVRTMLKYFNFRVLRQKDALAISAGLFTKVNTLVNPNKVQLSSINQNYFQKKFNLLNVKIKQAAYDAADREEHVKTDIEIPGCDQRERDELLKMIYQQVPETGQALQPDYRFILLQMIRWIVAPIAIIFWAGLHFYPPLRPYFPWILPYAGVVATMLYFEYKRHRLYVNDSFIIKQSGIWDISFEIIEPHKIQAITVQQYIWHKKADVGHVTLHTAAGALHFKFGNYQLIKHMVNFWMYQVECSSKDWN